MHKRPHALQVFLDNLRHELETIRVRKSARQCIERVFTALDQPHPVIARESIRLPACAYLDDALARVRGSHASLAAIAASFESLEPSLTWTRRANADATASSNFVDGHAN